MTTKRQVPPLEYAPNVDVDEIRYERRFVAFYDVLGWRQKTGWAGDSPKKIATMRNILMNFASLAAKKSDANVDDSEKMTTFSDNVVVSEKAGAKNFQFFLIRLGVVQTMALCSGFLIRGGVTVGNVVHDSNVVFGPALNRAYELESQVADYPRIVLDADRIDEFGKLPPLVVHEDGVYFLDPFRPEFVELLQKITTLTWGPVGSRGGASKLIGSFQKLSPLDGLVEPFEALMREVSEPLGEKEWRKVAWLFDRMAKTMRLPTRAKDYRRTVLHVR